MRIVRSLPARLATLLLISTKAPRAFYLLLFASFQLPLLAQVGGEIGFTSSAYPVSEKDGTAIITVTRTSQFGAVSVDLVVGDKGAKNGTDFKVAKTNTLVFKNYQTAVTLPIEIMDNARTNSAPFIDATLTLENAKSVDGDPDVKPTISSQLGKSTLQILDEDKLLQFNIEKTWYSLTEDTPSVQVKVLLAAPPGPDSQGVEVDYVVKFDTNLTTRAGSSHALAEDFEEQSGTLSFGADDIEKIIVVNIRKDQLIEFNEDFYFILTQARGTFTIQPPDGGTDGGSTGGTDGGADGGTDGGSTPEPIELPYTLGAIPAANITILFNGETSHPQPAGAVDRTFNADNDPDTFPPSNNFPGANNTVFAVAALPDGKSIIAGDFTSVNATTRNRIARLETNGVVDVTFNPIGGANDFVNAIAAYTNGPEAGKVLLVGGFTSVNGAPRNGIARLKSDGSLDTTFNPGTGADGVVYSVNLNKDGSIIVGGDFTTFNGVPRNRIVRLLPNGNVDFNFDPGTGPNGPVFALLSQTVEPVLLSGGQTNGPIQTTRVTGDAGANSGIVTLEFNFYSETNDMEVIYENRRLYYSGLTNHMVVTTNAQGEFITNFIPTVTSFPFSGNSSTLDFIINTRGTNENSTFYYKIAIQPDIDLGTYLGGDFTSYDGVDVGRIAKVKLDGSLDVDFAAASGLGANDTVFALAQQSDGKILLGGAFIEVDSLEFPGLARLNSDGSLDEEFGSGYGASDFVYTLLIDPQDRIYAGGSFHFFNLTRRVLLTRLLPDGTVDSTFMDNAYNNYAGFTDPDGGVPNGVINSVAVDPDGDVLVGGTFDQVGGGETRMDARPRRNFARLHGGQIEGPGTVSLLQDLFGADENSPALRLISSRTNGTLGGAAILLTTFDGAAISGTDYTGLTNEIVLWPVVGPLQTDGDTNNVITDVEILDDTEIEGDEDFRVQVEGVTGILTLGGEIILPGAALGKFIDARSIILENDITPTTISFTASEFDFNENDGSVTITVERGGNTARAISVRYVSKQLTGANAATEGTDYDRVNGTISFASGQTSRTFTIRLRDDFTVEPDESFNLEINSTSPGVVAGNYGTAKVNIIDNDYAPGRVNFSSANYSSVEGSQLVVTVKRSGGNVGVLQVDYATEDGTAIAGTDYTAVSGTLLWNDLESAPRTITIPIGPDDGLVEPNKQFRLVLKNPNPAGGLGTRSTATITILDDDKFGTFSFSAAEYLADENGNNVVVTVVRRGGSAQEASVQYATSNGTAVEGQHYQAATGRLQFGVGETSKSFVVPILDNSEVNEPRTVALTLSDPQPPGATLGTLTKANVVIIDNETVNIPAGSVETDFATGQGANGPVHALALRQDGKILIGGDFLLVDRQVRTRLALLNANGTLDPVFVTGEVNGSIRDIALQDDGRMIVSGTFTSIEDFPVNYLARISAGGLLDRTFNVGSGADNPIHAVRIIKVGQEQKVLIGGSFSVFNGKARRGIARVNSDGRTDLTFDPGAGVGGTVFAILVQRDGKIVIGGEFVSVDGLPRINIARLNADGSLDTTFNPDLSTDNSVRTLALQFDDKILVGGLFTSVSGETRPYMVRLDPNGNVDSSFNPGSGPNGSVYSIAVQADGKILAGGDFTAFNGVRANRIVRLNSDGSIDTSINFGAGANAFVGEVVVQPDRRILIGGGFTSVDGVPRGRYARLYGGALSGAGELEFLVANFVANENSTNAVVTVRRTGALTGRVTVDYSTSAGTAEALADYIDVTGTLVFASGENEKTFLVPLVNDNIAEPNEVVNLRLSNATGGATLVRQPVATLTLISDDSVVGFSAASYTVNENPAGGSVIIQVNREGETAFPVSVAYSTAPGTAQPGADYQHQTGTLTFAAGERLKFFSIPILEDTLVEGNETVLLNLVVQGTGAVPGRVQSTLTILDNDFAPGVLNVLASPGAAEAEGSIVITVERVSGKTGNVSVDYAVSDVTARKGEDYLAPNSTLTFMEGETSKSFVVTLLDDTIVEGRELFKVTLVNATGGATIGTREVTVPILDDDSGPGSLDVTFVPAISTDNPMVRSIKLESDGDIVVGGDFVLPGNPARRYITRLVPNGALDPAFNPGSGPNALVSDVEIDSEGRLMIAGQFNTVGGQLYSRVARLVNNGGLDPTFNLPLGLNNEVLDLVQEAEDPKRIIIGGRFDTASAAGRNRIARLLNNGLVDTSFDPGTGANNIVHAVALQKVGGSNKVLIGGAFDRVDAFGRSRIARLNEDGKVDLSFLIGFGANGTVYDILVLPDGKILVAGDFTTFNGAPRVRVARLNPDGSLDDTFVTATGPNGVVYALAVQNDGKYFIAGDFNFVGSSRKVRVARLKTDGSLDEGLTGFDPGEGPNGPVRTLAVQSDGKLLIGGDFNKVDSRDRGGIARLINDKQFEPPADIQVSAQPVGTDSIRLVFTTTPGVSYEIQASTDLSSPNNWTTIGTLQATSTSSESIQLRDKPYQFFRIRRAN